MLSENSNFLILVGPVIMTLRAAKGYKPGQPEINAKVVTTVNKAIFLRRKARAPSMLIHRRCSSTENTRWMLYRKLPELTKSSVSQRRFHQNSRLSLM
jgi:hypothetical protein